MVFAKFCAIRCKAADLMKSRPLDTRTRGRRIRTAQGIEIYTTGVSDGRSCRMRYTCW